MTKNNHHTDDEGKDSPRLSCFQHPPPPPHTSNKRKAAPSSSSQEEKEGKQKQGDDNVVVMLPRLPPSAWGLVMNYLYYDDVKSVKSIFCFNLRASFPMHVTDLTITRTSDLSPQRPLPLLYPNVERVTILSLFRLYGNLWQHTHPIPVIERICHETAQFLVPFLTRFPKLTHVTFGPKAYRFRARGSRVDDDQRSTYRALIRSFVDAFKLGMLRSGSTCNSIIKIDGLFGYGDEELTTEQYEVMHDIRVSRNNSIRAASNNTSSSGCCLCKEVVRIFPFETVFLLHGRPVGDEYGYGGYILGHLCLELEETCRILFNRPGGKEWFQSGRPMILYLTRNRTCTYADGGDSNVVGSFAERMKQRGARDPDYISYFERRVLDRVAIMKERYGCDPRQLDPDDVAYHIGRGDVLPKTVFNQLSKLGLPMEEERYCVFDDEKEPTMKEWKQEKLYWWKD